MTQQTQMIDELHRIANVLEKELPRLNSNLKNINSALTGEGGLDANAGYVASRLETIADELCRIADKQGD